MNQPEAAAGGVVLHLVAQEVPRFAQQGRIIGLQGRMIPEAAPERRFPQQAITVPPRAHEIRWRYQRIAGRMQPGDQPAKGAVTRDLPCHIARKGHAGLAQGHAVNPGHSGCKPARRQRRQKLPVPCRNGPGHRHARSGQGATPPQLRPDGCGRLVACPVQPQGRAA